MWCQMKFILNKYRIYVNIFQNYSSKAKKYCYIRKMVYRFHFSIGNDVKHREL